MEKNNPLSLDPHLKEKQRTPTNKIITTSFHHGEHNYKNCSEKHHCSEKKMGGVYNINAIYIRKKK